MLGDWFDDLIDGKDEMCGNAIDGAHQISDGCIYATMTLQKHRSDKGCV